MNFIRNLTSCCFLELKTKVTFNRSFNSYVFQHSFVQKSSLKLNTSSNQPLKRNFYTWFMRRSPSTLKKNDKIPAECTLVYRTTFDKYIIGCQWITTTLAAILVCQIVFSKDFINSPSYEQFENKPRVTNNEAYIYMFTFIGFILILHLMITRIPVRIYNYPDTKRYIFVFYGNLPLSKKHVMCAAKELVKVEEQGIVPWKDSRYKIIKQGQPETDVLLWDHYFRKPSDMNIMLGYEKDPNESKSK